MYMYLIPCQLGNIGGKGGEARKLACGLLLISLLDFCHSLLSFYSTCIFCLNVELDIVFRNQGVALFLFEFFLFEYILFKELHVITY